MDEHQDLEKAERDKLIAETRWVKSNKTKGSLLSAFTLGTQKEMLKILTGIKDGVPHKYKEAYSINLENKIKVLEYLVNKGV